MTKNRYDKRKKEESMKIYKVFICIKRKVAHKYVVDDFKINMDIKNVVEINFL